MARSDVTHSALSRTDDIAAAWGDFLLLLGRVLVGWLFLAAGYGKVTNNLGMSPAEFWAWVAGILEVLLGAALILGVATRYAALATFVWVLIATAIAHRYWTYPAAQQAAQYNNFLKNIAIMGGALCLFVTGAGRFSWDKKLGER